MITLLLLLAHVNKVVRNIESKQIVFLPVLIIPLILSIVKYSAASLANWYVTGDCVSGLSESVADTVVT